MKKLFLGFLATISGIAPLFSEITLVADQPYPDPVPPVVFTVDPELNGRAARGVSGTRQLRQTFQLTETIDVDELVLSLNLNGTDGGLEIRIYEIADTTATTWIPGALVKTIIFDQTVDLPATGTTLGVLLTDDDVFRLNGKVGPEGYGIELNNGGGDIGLWTHANSGTDHYLEGLMFKEDGNISRADRDFGLAVVGEIPVIDPDAVPDFIIHPEGMIAFENEPFTLTASAEGADAISYQWQLNGVDIPRATAETYTNPSALASDAGDYSVVATNLNGSTTSNIATIGIVSRVSGLFNTGVDDFGVLLEDGVVDPHYQIAINPDAETPDAIIMDTIMLPGAWEANSEASKWIGPRFTSGGGAAGDYTYRTTFDLTGFDPSTAFIEGNWSSDNAGLDVVINGTSTQISRSGYTLAPFRIEPGHFVSGINTLEFIVNNSADGSTGFRVEAIRAGALAGGITGPPVILRQPESVDTLIGDQVNLSVLADGEGSLSYQWKFNGEDLGGATSASITLFNISEASLGDYQVVITNSFGSVTSEVATITRRELPPVILTQPRNTFAAFGETPSFSVVAEGTMPMSYQWRRNGTEIAGATSATFTAEPVTLANDGETYDVIVTNIDGTLLSDTVSLSVFQARVPGVYSTGVDDNGLPLEDDLIDPHYSYLANAESGMPEAQASGDVPDAWVPNNEVSRWIGANYNTRTSPGLYTYQTTFDLTGFNLDTVVLFGSWSADDVSGEVRLNGVPTTVPATTGFATLTPFSIDTGFVDGINTLEFDVTNNGTAANPTGLRVDDLHAFGVSYALSTLEITSIVYSESPRSVELTWNSIAGAKYIIESSRDLENWDIELNDSYPSGGETTTYIDRDAVNLGDKFFYRVRLAP